MANVERRAHVVWEGDLASGSGRLTEESSKVIEEAPVTFASRVERPDGKTSPEELIASAHATCYAMALSNTLAEKDDERGGEAHKEGCLVPDTVGPLPD